MDRNGAIYIATTVIRLIGGVVTVLKIFIPRVVVRVVNGLNRKKINVVNDVVNHGRKSKNNLQTIRSDISRSGREQECWLNVIVDSAWTLHLMLCTCFLIVLGIVVFAFSFYNHSLSLALLSQLNKVFIRSAFDEQYISWCISFMILW
jgi:hypothetical protein